MIKPSISRLLLSAFALCCVILPARAQGVPASPDAPALALADTGGTPRSLADYRGRVVVLNFWATWCVPCREEMPLLVALRNAYAARGVEVVGASADDESTRAKVVPFARELKLNFPVWVGATTDDMRRFGLGSALPATAVRDRDGRVVFRIMGPVTAAELRERVEWLLGDRKAQAPAAAVNNIKPHAHDGEEAGHKHEGEAEREGEAGHEDEEEHGHGGVGMEGASTVPS
ncbi:MAG TPA: TlpA disulfide reductase family protein [Pyrinomonadaceae bacterium]|nr:TlpA disulfide reductase family protein [Pyrinomonadaceae bacterium]